MQDELPGKAQKQDNPIDMRPTCSESCVYTGKGARLTKNLELELKEVLNNNPSTMIETLYLGGSFGRQSPLMLLWQRTPTTSPDTTTSLITAAAAISCTTV
jgi:hypothetical protein